MLDGQAVKCVPSKHWVLSLTPRSCVKMSGMLVCAFSPGQGAGMVAIRTTVVLIVQTLGNLS